MTLRHEVTGVMDRIPSRARMMEIEGELEAIQSRRLVLHNAPLTTDTARRLAYLDTIERDLFAEYNALKETP